MPIQRLPPLPPARLLEALQDARVSGLDDTQLPIITVHLASGSEFRGRLIAFEPAGGLLLTSDSRNREAHVLYFDPAHVTAVHVEDAGKFESLLSLKPRIQEIRAISPLQLKRAVVAEAQKVSDSFGTAVTFELVGYPVEDSADARGRALLVVEDASGALRDLAADPVALPAFAKGPKVVRFEPGATPSVKLENGLLRIISSSENRLSRDQMVTGIGNLL